MHTINYEGKDNFKGSKGWCDKFIQRNKPKIEAWRKVYLKVTEGE